MNDIVSAGYHRGMASVNGPGDLREAVSQAAPALVASGTAGPLVLAGTREDQRGVWLHLLDAGGRPVAVRVEVGPLGGHAARLQAGYGPGYQVIRLPERAAPHAAGALLAAGLRDLRAAREAGTQPGNLLVAGTSVPDKPRLTVADRSRLGELDRAAGAMSDPRRGPREQDAARARFMQLAARLGLRPALPGDARAVQARRDIAAAALSPAAAAALRGPAGRSAPLMSQEAAGLGGRHDLAAGVLAGCAVAVPVLAAAAGQAQAPPALASSGRGALAAGPLPRQLAAAGRGAGRPGAGTLARRALAAAGQAAPGTPDGPELGL